MCTAKQTAYTVPGRPCRQTERGISPGSRACVQRGESHNRTLEGLCLQEVSLAVGSCYDMDPEQAAEDALAQLDELAGQVDALAERCNKLNACQEQFAVAQTDFKDPALLQG